MKIERVLDRRTRDIIQLNDLYSVARICGMDSDTLNQRVQEIQNTTLHGCPYWAVTYFQGFRAALTERLYRESLAYGGYVDGAFYSTHSARPDYYGKHGIAPAEYADNGRVTGRGHYWITTDKPRPFFIGSRAPAESTNQ